MRIFKLLWVYRFEACIALSAILMLVNMFFPAVLPAGFYICLLIIFLISILLLKLSSFSEKLKEKVKRGEFL